MTKSNYLKITLLGIFLILILAIGWVSWMSSKSLTTAKNFYSQYNNCLSSNGINQCANELKNNYPKLSLNLPDSSNLQMLTIEQRKFNLATLYNHNLPLLKNTHFILEKIGINEARIILSGDLDWGENNLTEAQLNILRGGLAKVYPDFVLTKPLSYEFDLIKTKSGWQISDIFYLPPTLGKEVSTAITKCESLLKGENQESALCVENNGKVSLLPFIFNQAGFLANEATKDSDSENPVDLTSEQPILNSLKADSLIIYVVDFNKILAKEPLANLVVNPLTKEASLIPIVKPDKPTSFCAIITPLFKDGAFLTQPSDYIAKNSVLTGKSGYLICSPEISWQKDNNLIWGVAGYLKNLSSEDKLADSYLGFKLLLPPQSYYGNKLNPFGYDQSIGNGGQVFYRRAIPLKALNF